MDWSPIHGALLVASLVSLRPATWICQGILSYAEENRQRQGENSTLRETLIRSPKRKKLFLLLVLLLLLPMVMLETCWVHASRAPSSPPLRPVREGLTFRA